MHFIIELSVSREKHKFSIYSFYNLQLQTLKEEVHIGDFVSSDLYEQDALRCSKVLNA